jgi:MFS family permease
MSDSNQRASSNAAGVPGDTGEAAVRALVAEPRLTADARRRSLWRRLASPLVRSLIAVLIGTLILRLASHAMGQMTQFYLDHISRSYYYISHTTGAYVIAAFFVTELLGSLVFGTMSDRYGRRLFIILGPVLGLIAVQITSMTSALWLLVFARLIAGLSTGSSVPATLGYISDATVGRPILRARVIGIFEITLVGGIALGAIVGGYLWKFFPNEQTVAGIRLMSPAFTFNALIFLVSAAVFAWGLRDLKRAKSMRVERNAISPPVAAGRKLGHYYDAFKSPSIWMFSPAWISVFAIVGMWINVSARLFTGQKQYEGQLLTGAVAPEKFENGFATLAVFFALGVLAWSFVLARYRKTNVMLVSTVALFGLIVTVFALNHLSSYSSPFYYLLLGMLLIGVLVLSGFTPAALTYLADVTERFTENRGSIMGLYSVFLGVGQLLGTSIGGYFAEWNGVDGLLMLSAIFGAITAISLVALRRREPPPPIAVQAPAGNNR